MLEGVLSKFGLVISTRILRNADGQSRGVGFARMDSKVRFYIVFLVSSCDDQYFRFDCHQLHFVGEVRGDHQQLERQTPRGHDARAAGASRQAG